MKSYKHKGLTQEECRDLNKGKSAKDVGERFIVTSGAGVGVVAYDGTLKVGVRFDSGQEVVVQANHLRNGNIRDVFAKSVVNIGYLGGDEYGHKTHREAYVSWQDMLKRAYCPKYHEQKPTYVDVTVCEEWHNFQTFAKWWLEQPNAGVKGYHLDKDLINEGAKRYSPENCSFVPQLVNSLLNDRGAARGALPIGVSRNSGGYQAQLKKDGKRQHLGTYFCFNTAAEVYRKAKAGHVREVANSLTPDEAVPEVITGLLRWADKLENVTN